MNEASIEILCRLCLNKSYFYVNIYVGQSTGSEPIYETINYVYDLQITIDDQLPEYVCQQCLSMVHEFDRYKKSAQKAKVELMRLKRKMHETPLSVREGTISCKSLAPEVQESNNGLQIFIKQEVKSDDEVENDPLHSVFDDSLPPQNQTVIKQEGTSEDKVEDCDPLDSMCDNTVLLQNQVKVKEEEITIEECQPFVVECVFGGVNQGERMDEVSGDMSTARRGVDWGRMLMCHQCGERKGTKEEIAAHIEMAHGFGEGEDKESGHAKSGSKRKKIICSVCSKEFTRNHSLVDHMRIHAGVKPYKCSVCEYRFSQPGNLKSHMRIHSGIKRYKCVVCGMRFRLKDTLNKHMRTHTGDRPYKCSVCEMRFSQKCHLTTHRKIHTGDKPYECPVCKMRFSVKYSLDRHSVIHTGDKPFQCSLCECKFTQNGHLKYHMKTHNK